MVGSLMRLLMGNSGAQKGGLILYRGDELYLEIAVEKAAGRFIDLAPAPLAGNSHLSAAIVQYVVRTGEALLLADAGAEGAFVRDPYVAENSVKSVCCLTVSGRGRLAGFLYLENNLIAGAFSRMRLEMLQLLGAQAAFVMMLSRLPAQDPHHPGSREILPPLEPLTSRETEVLNLIAAGHSNTEIAEMLVLTVSTVKSHIQNIYGKMGVNRRLQAVTRANDMKLLEKE